jgi:hypothetical protein
MDTNGAGAGCTACAGSTTAAGTTAAAHITCVAAAAPDVSSTPAAPVVVLEYVAATMTLSGYTVKTFGTAEATKFKSAVAAGLSVQPSAITITAVTAAPARRRNLLDAGVTIAFTVATSGSTATLTTSIAAISGAAAVTALQGAGLTLCTSVAVGTPAVTTTVPVTATTLPNTAVSGAPALKALVLSALAVALAVCL